MVRTTRVKNPEDVSLGSMERNRAKQERAAKRAFVIKSMDEDESGEVINFLIAAIDGRQKKPFIADCVRNFGGISQKAVDRSLEFLCPAFASGLILEKAGPTLGREWPFLWCLKVLKTTPIPRDKRFEDDWFQWLFQRYQTCGCLLRNFELPITPRSWKLQWGAYSFVVDDGHMQDDSKLVNLIVHNGSGTTRPLDGIWIFTYSQLQCFEIENNYSDEIAKLRNQKTGDGRDLIVMFGDVVCKSARDAVVGPCVKQQVKQEQGMSPMYKLDLGCRSTYTVSEPSSPQPSPAAASSSIYQACQSPSKQTTPHDAVLRTPPSKKAKSCLGIPSPPAKSGSPLLALPAP